jgi:CRISPR-associated endonuclease/helicase Cas3
MRFNEPLYCYWGKAQPRSVEGAQWHMLVYHSLDVAAAGKTFLQRHHRLRQHLSRAFGLAEDVFLKWLVFFLALHDLGKFAARFQGQNQTLFIALHGQRDTIQPYTVRHDSLGFLFWEEVLWQQLEQEDWFGLHADRQALQSWRKGFACWARAVTGHHGKPPQEESYILRHHFSPTDKQAALAFCHAARDLLLTDVAVETLPDARDFRKQSTKISWWLAGIAVLADWIGSNVDYFPYHDTPIPLVDYWQTAQGNAAKALMDVGVLPSAMSTRQTFDGLFPQLAQPTPLQNQAGSLPLGEGPQLCIFEDVTGAGKTEAAVLLAKRLMNAGVGSGFYIGLPTMATADSMYVRMADVYRCLFADEAQPSLILAHSTRHLSDRFRQSVLPTTQAAELDYDTDEYSATTHCNAWLADSRKKALLAEVGVGTIDQALQAILYCKHQSLRLLGLFGKVLIVDEVHACDTYMYKLLQVLLRFHASIGGSAILLSATLPHTMRAGLVRAFCEGTEQTPPELTEQHYPLLTHVSGATITEYPLATRPEVERKVEVRWIAQTDEVETLILEATRSGRCVCWIRNTVADAREAYAWLLGKVPRDKLDLFHARFAMGDRLEIEQRVLQRFGKHGAAEQRAGCVVIATQVVEQSLDLDFDVMIADLAPIDLLIQRAGRLCRHTRDRLGNVIKGPDQRGTPCLVVHGPEPVADAPEDWYAAYFPKAAPVYPNHGQLWVTARMLQERGGFRMPQDARQLIEGVYDDDVAEAEMPPALLESHFDVEGEQSANRSQAQLNSLKLDAGYQMDNLTWWDDAVTPTRLGEPSSTVRLARWDGQTLNPWYDAGEFTWDLSQVQVRQALLKSTATSADSHLQAAVKTLVEQLPDKGKWSVLLPLSEQRDGLWSGQAVDGRGQVVQVFYDQCLGLYLEREAPAE